MKNVLQPQTSLIEALEPRLAPAGIVIVSVSGGVLTLTGDGLDNAIKITSPSANIWKIEDMSEGPPENDTHFRFAGDPPTTTYTTLDLRTFSGLKVVLNGGDDKLDAIGLFTNGAVTLQGGEGNDEMFISGTLNGAITLDGGNGNDDLGIIAGFINNTVTVKAGAGDDRVFFGSGNFTKGITADLGTGTNDFTLRTDSSVNVFGQVNVTAAGGATNTQTYFIATTNGTVTGNVSFKTTAGASNFYIGRDADDSTTINGSLTLQGAAGNDTVLLAGRISVGGGMIASLGAGTNGMFNSIDVNNNDASQLVQLGLGSLAYTGGAGDDRVYLDCPYVIMGGNVTASMGAGNNAMSFFNINGILIGGSLTYTGGTGDDRLDFAGADLTIGGKLTFKGGGAQSLNPQAQNTDGFYLYTTYAALHSVELLGGATGRDFFYIGVPEAADIGFDSTLISVLGDITINTGAGYSAAEITDAVVHGKVTHTSSVAASLFDVFYLEDTYIQGALTINTGGAAKADIQINDSVCFSNVNITTGAGDDRVDFDTRDTASQSVTSFYGAVNISLGAGNDMWVAGWNPVNATVGNQFKSTVKIDGGSGSNENNQSYYGLTLPYNNTFAIDPVFAGIMARY